MNKLLDHRQIADDMEIYCLDEKIGAGLPLWLPAGVAIRDALESMMRQLEGDGGYRRVVSPHIGKRELYERSGHLKAFAEEMFPPIGLGAEEYFLRPMNCPHHHVIFGAGVKSYRQLPYRIAEFGQVYRNERSGALRGLSRVRGLCQNDAHIYVAPDESKAEILSVLRLHERVYKILGLRSYHYRLSKSDPAKQELFEGPPEQWKRAEAVLRSALCELELPFVESIGEAAFYGPKIDVQMPIGIEPSVRSESIASVQLDFNSGEKFDLKYVDRDGLKAVPWVVHRAPLGSHERMVSLLLEQSQGHFPGWLAPIQIAIVPVDARHEDHARKVHRNLVSGGIRSEIIQPIGSLGKRMKMLHRKRPFAKLVLGDEELLAQPSEVSWRVVLMEGAHVVRRNDLVSFVRLLVKPPWVDD
ncbi:MAG: threonine--tRNA ligase [Deltaproteobacteria bacterium]|jgi:threonyl-tRNA synthetase|nr:threonine--tRNA ligase [Deltaproteobacteria bacterium]